MLKQTCQKSPLKQTVVAHSIYFHELKFSIKSVFGYNFRQNLAFHEFIEFLYSNFRLVFAFHDFIEFLYTNFRQNLVFHEIPDSNFCSVFAFHGFFEFPYSNFRQNLAFHAIFRFPIVDNYKFSVQNCH